MDLLATYIVAWRDTADRLLELCRGLDAHDWGRVTDLPRWDVHDVVAHLADIESRFASASDGDAAAADPYDDPGAGRRTVVTPDLTQPGVDVRRDTGPDALLAELAVAVRRRATALAQQPPDDAAAPVPRLPARLKWDWGTMLRNRAIDVWVHEQDIRRAVDRPGGLEAPAAQVSVDTFVAALPYVLGKVVAAPPGVSVAWRLTGGVPLDVTLEVGADGRARPVDDPEGAPTTVLLAMDSETFTVLAAGRRVVDRLLADGMVEIHGDPDLARRVLTAMAVTP